jgi:hypothetical protein
MALPTPLSTLRWRSFRYGSQFGSEWLVGLRAATLTKISATKKINPPTDTARTERKKAKK